MLAPETQGRRGSVSGRYTPSPREAFIHAVQRGEWSEVEPLLRSGAVPAPQTTLPIALSYALGQFVASIKARGLPLSRLRYNLHSSGSGVNSSYELTRDTTQWARRLDLFFSVAKREGVDLKHWWVADVSRLDHTIEWKEGVMAWVLKECSVESGRALLTTTPAQERRLGRACNALEVKLEELLREFEQEDPTLTGVKCAKNHIQRMRSKNVRELAMMLSGQHSSSPLYPGDQPAHAKIKELLLESPEGKELGAVVFERDWFERECAERFSDVCCFDVGAAKRRALIHRVLSDDLFVDLTFNVSLETAEEHGRWEWVRDILDTGRITGWDGFVYGLKLFLHDLWSAILKLIRK